MQINMFTLSLMIRRSLSADQWAFKDRYAWNHHMLVEAFGKRSDDDDKLVVKSHWTLPLVHGHVDQASQSFFLP